MVLENHLLPFMEIHRVSHVLQDGAPCHTSKKVKDFLKEKEVMVMDSPGNSSDLNLIENCGSTWKTSWRRRAASHLFLFWRKRYSNETMGSGNHTGVPEEIVRQHA
jgi:hypothetical protein